MTHLQDPEDYGSEDWDATIPDYAPSWPDQPGDTPMGWDDE